MSIKLKLLETTTTQRRTPPLTAQQAAFVAALLASEAFNPTEAARQVGYKDAPKSAWRLMQNPSVRKALGKAQRERAERAEITADKVLAEIAAVAFSNPKDMLKPDGGIMSLRDMPKHTAAAIRDINVGFSENPDEEGQFSRQMFCSVKLHDKLTALGLLSKHLGLLEDKAKPQAAHPGLIPVDFDKLLFGEEDRSGDPIENRLRAEEGLPPLPAPSTPDPQPPTASNGNGHGKPANGKANGKRTISPRKTPAK
jgi:phage terminase small subunit